MSMKIVLGDSGEAKPAHARRPARSGRAARGVVIASRGYGSAERNQAISAATRPVLPGAVVPRGHGAAGNQSSLRQAGVPTVVGRGLPREAIETPTERVAQIV